jgi:hypothetical protein
MKALVVPASRALDIYEADITDAEIHGLVGGYFELAYTRSLIVAVFVNEDGLRLNLDVNPRATRLLQFGAPEVGFESSFEWGDYLVGQVVITGRDGVETVDLPERTRSAFVRTLTA